MAYTDSFKLNPDFTGLRQEAGRSTSQSRTTTPSTTAPATPAPGANLSDSDLEKAIRAKLESDDALKQAKLSVSADAKDNKATISGTVVSQEMRS